MGSIPPCIFGEYSEGYINPLASFEKIASVFNLTRGAIVSHYKRGLEIRECGRPNILSDAQINTLIDFVY